MPKLPKSLADQRTAALAALPKDELARHETFRVCLYPRIGYQYDFRLHQPEEVTILSYGFDERAETLIPTILCRGKDGRAFRCSIDMVYLAQAEAWDEITKDLQEGIRDAQKALLEHTQNLVNMQLQLDTAHALAKEKAQPA